MKKIKELIIKYERPLKTFVEAFASYIAVNVAVTDFTSETALQGLIVGALASAISILINSVNKEVSL